MPQLETLTPPPPEAPRRDPAPPALPAFEPPPLPAPSPSGRAKHGWRRWLALAALLAMGGAIAWQFLASAPASPATSGTAAAVTRIARGQIRPVAQARIGTLGGGTVAQLLVVVGQAVRAEQEIARVRGPESTEVVTAPWAGTITGLPAHMGDTALAGATLATLGDLSRVQVETTDVDEFLIPYVRPGRVLTMTVDALDGRALVGRVRSVTLEPQTTATGDDYYPVVIDLAEQLPELRLGMTVRINLAE